MKLSEVLENIFHFIIFEYFVAGRSKKKVVVIYLK